MLATEAPFLQFFDTDGSPLDSGSLYFGVANQNPETNPVAIYWDEAGTQPAAQPVATLNGYPVRNGTPSTVFVASDYSLTVRNSRGNLVYTAASSAEFSNTFALQSPTGAGNIGFDYGETYAAGSIGKWLQDLATSAGAAFIGFIQAGVGAVTRTAQSKMREWVSPEDFGAAGDGVADDTAELQAALDTGKRVRLTPGSTYKVTSRLSVPAGGGMFSDGTARIYAPAASFNNASLAGKYAANSAVVDASGLLVAPFTPKTNVLLKDFIIQSEVSAGRLVDAITARNVNGLTIDGVEAYGFPVGCGVRAASIVGDSAIKNCKIHDFTDNTNWGGGATPQITGIEIDNDRINSIGSKQLKITHNHVHDITVGATFLAAHGYQTDAINIAHQDCQYFTINDNTIENVGEGIDVFGQYGVVANNNIQNSYTIGIKIIHGARNNVISGNTITAAGLTGIVLAGSTTATEDTTKNVVIGNIIQNIDPNGVWAASSTSCIETTNNGGVTYKPRENLIIGNTLNPTPNGKRAINRSSSGADNWFKDNYIISAGSSDYATNTLGESGRIRDAKSTLVRAYANTGQSIPNGAGYTKIAFDTELIDDRGEFNIGTYRWTCQIPGVYKASARIRFGSFTAGSTFTLAIYKNGAAVHTHWHRPGQASDFSIAVDDLVECVFNDYLEIFVNHTDGAPRAITAGSLYSAFIVEAA